jgi:hypothetical protein
MDKCFPLSASHSLERASHSIETVPQSMPQYHTAPHSTLYRYEKLNKKSAKGSEEEEKEASNEAVFKQKLTTLVVSPLLQRSSESIKRG